MLAVSRGYTITVDYRKSVSHMIVDHQYGLSLGSCAQAYLPRTQFIPEKERGVVSTKVFLADIDYDASSNEVIRQIKGLKFRSVGFEELITFGCAFTDVCEESSITALGTGIIVAHVGVFVPWLRYFRTSHLTLDLVPQDKVFGRRFLVVPES